MLLLQKYFFEHFVVCMFSLRSLMSHSSIMFSKF
jgi:hypothetical protein